MEDIREDSFERQVKKLLNQVTCEIMHRTVQSITDFMQRSGNPAADRLVAKLIVDSLSQKGSLNLHVSVLGMLVCSLDEHLRTLLPETDEKPKISFGAIVVDAFWERLQKMLTAASLDEQTERLTPQNPLSREQQLRRSLVNYCRFVPSLFHGGLFDEAAVSVLLKRLTVNAGGASEVEVAASPCEMPNALDPHTVVTLMSGTAPSVQPVPGESDFMFRCRLGLELGLPPDRLVLVANGAELTSPQVNLDELNGIPVTVLVRPGALKPEHLVEAACALLTDLDRDLRVTETGSVLADQAVLDLVRVKPDLPKRVQFKILDLEEATQASKPLAHDGPSGALGIKFRSAG